MPKKLLMIVSKCEFMQELEFRVEPKDIGNRLDKAVAESFGISRSLVTQLIEKKMVLVNGIKKTKSYLLEPKDTILVTIPPPEETTLLPQNIELEIVYEDKDLLVINKAKGMVVHPGAGNHKDTMANALLAHCADSLSGIGGEKRPGIVHRIDKDTSGLLVVAKNDNAHQKLAQQFAEHSSKRIYHAIIYGHFKDSSGIVNAPIGRNTADRTKMAVTTKNSRSAVTNYKVLGEYPGFSYLELQLETGRTHQIRVHMAHMGHPLAGDKVYGPKKGLDELKGQCLHAKTLGFVHPTTQEYLEFNSELPKYFIGFLHKLEKRNN